MQFLGCVLWGQAPVLGTSWRTGAWPNRATGRGWIFYTSNGNLELYTV